MVSVDSFRPRLWPIVAMLAIAALCVFVLPAMFTRTSAHFFGMLGGPVMCSLGVVAWWLRGLEGQGKYRWLPFVLFLLPSFALAATLYRGDTKFVFAFGFPFIGLLWVVWLLVSIPFQWRVRRVGVMATIILGWSFFSLIRIDQTSAELKPELSWRWMPTSEEQYISELAMRKPSVSAVATETASVKPGDWAEFRGPKRDNRIEAVTFDTNWATSPPKLLWKQRIGPGWGSFAVVGDRLFTLEQRGENEVAACYNATNGAEVWSHEMKGRFFEQIAGAGPRSTPTIDGNKLYALGATGNLICLDAATGERNWLTNITSDTGGRPPEWGYSSSPLIVDGIAIVYAGGPNGKGTAGFSIADGRFLWASGDASHGYSSGHRATIHGVNQVLMVSNFGLESFSPKDGKRLWVDEWNIKKLNRVMQPLMVGDSEAIYGQAVGGVQGVRRMKVLKTGETWSTELVWFSGGLKPYFNDAVIHEGHAYGFEGGALACIDVATGRQKWKAGLQYGHGQVILFPAQGVLLVQAVDGKIVLVEANPNEHVELAKFTALKGKTWNHPVYAHGKLYLRNGEEAACYELIAK